MEKRKNVNMGQLWWLLAIHQGWLVYSAALKYCDYYDSPEHKYYIK